MASVRDVMDETLKLHGGIEIEEFCKISEFHRQFWEDLCNKSAKAFKGVEAENYPSDLDEATILTDSEYQEFMIRLKGS